MIVGGEAVIFYGHIRMTGDVDVYYDRSPENATRLYRALEEFWSGEIPGLRNPSDLESPGVIFQFGVPPNRIDLLNEIDGVRFADAWPHRAEVIIATDREPIAVDYIGLEALILNKRASARPKDLDDLPYLEEALRRRHSEN